MNNLEAEIKKLKAQMTKDQLCPAERIIVDDQRHEFITYINGKKEEAYYIASHYPGGWARPVLGCTYGLLNKPIQYHYSSPDDKTM